MNRRTFPDGSEILTDDQGVRTVIGKMAHDEYLRLLRIEGSHLANCFVEPHKQQEGREKLALARREGGV